MWIRHYHGRVQLRLAQRAGKIERWWRAHFYRDHCEICHGRRGGVRGNENVVGWLGVIMCDYCHVEYEDKQRARQSAIKPTVV